MTEGRNNELPGRIVAAAALCAALALPMLGAAGSMAAAATSQDGLAPVPAALLAFAVLGIAVVNLYGAAMLVQRGTPRYAQTGGYLTIGITAVLLAGLAASQSTGIAVTVALVFAGPAVAMLTLLGTRRARRWMLARSRSWRALAGS